MSGSAFAVTHHAFSSGAGRTSDGNGSHASTLKSPSYTKSVSWQHYRHIDRMRKPEVSPLVSIRDGNQVVAEVPRHEKARLEWEIFRDDEVFRQQRWELTGLTGRVISRGLLYTPAVMLVGIGILAWGSPQDAIQLINALRNMPAAELVHQIGFVLCLVLQISVISVLIADVVAGRGLPNVFRRVLLDRLPAEFCLIRKGTER